MKTLSLLLVLTLAGCAADTRSENASAAAGAAPVATPTDAHAEAPPTGELDPGGASVPGRIERTDEEWRAQLTSEQYHVTREKGTERAFTGKYWDSKAKGTFLCVCCENELFSSDTKFKSGTGWPSFWQPIADGQVAEESDKTFGMVRTEVLCARCDAHLGHVFPDGPDPTGLRYCINSASLVLREAE